MKKRIVTIALVVALMATCFAGTYAYLTDTHAQKNTFTTGNVLITLDEAVVAKNAEGNLVATGERIVDGAKDQSYHLYPAMTVTKDPTIRMDAESEDAWIAAKVIISGAQLHELIPMEGDSTNSLININAIANGGLLKKASTPTANWNNLPVVHETEDCVLYQVANGNDSWTIYIFMKAEYEKNEEITLFETLQIPSEWDNKEMTMINNMIIDVEAYAVQVNGFADCFTAMTTAFPDQFKFN